MKMETERLIITQFEHWMVEDVQKQSMDRDTRHYLPDEVFETQENFKVVDGRITESWG